jgi:hypothetical protein
MGWVCLGESHGGFRYDVMMGVATEAQGSYWGRIAFGDIPFII